MESLVNCQTKQIIPQEQQIEKQINLLISNFSFPPKKMLNSNRKSTETLCRESQGVANLAQLATGLPDPKIFMNENTALLSVQHKSRSPKKKQKKKKPKKRNLRCVVAVEERCVEDALRRREASQQSQSVFHSE